MLRRACQTRHARPDIRITDRSGMQGTWDGSPGPVATIPIDWACTGNNRAIVAVTPDRRRLRFGAITSILSGVTALLNSSYWPGIDQVSGWAVFKSSRVNRLINETPCASIIFLPSCSCRSTITRA